MTAPEILPGLLELLEVEHGRSHSAEGTEVVMCGKCRLRDDSDLQRYSRTRPSGQNPVTR
jgi:hypothetical protein